MTIAIAGLLSPSSDATISPAARVRTNWYSAVFSTKRPSRVDKGAFFLGILIDKPGQNRLETLKARL